MYHYSHHSLVDEHEDSIRVHDWVAQQYPMPDGVEQRKIPHSEISLANKSLEDFTSWSSSAASSTPALDTVNDDEDHYLKDETDVESDLDALNSHMEQASVIFREGRSTDGDGSESETQKLATEKPLPIPPPSSSLTDHSPSPSVSVSIAESSRSRKPSVISLSGYHLPSSVQIPTSSQTSPRPSHTSLSRQSSCNGHIFHLGAPHSRQPSLNRQPSLPLLSPSSSLTLFEEDDKLEFCGKSSSPEGSTVISHNRSSSKLDSLSRDQANIQDLSRSGSGSSRSSSSLKRQSCQSGMGSSNHSCAENPLNNAPYPTRGHRLHSPSLPSLLTSTPTPSRRSAAMSCQLSAHGIDRSPHFADGDVQVTHQPLFVDSSPVSTTLLAPPPSATFGTSSSPFGVAAENAHVTTPRNRDAVYINAFDSEEVQRRLAELLIASGTADSSAGGDVRSSERDEGQFVEYCSNDFVNSHRELCQPMSSQTELPSQYLGSHKTPVPEHPKDEHSHWSPSSSNEYLPLSAASNLTVSSDRSDTTTKPTSPTPSDGYNYGVGFGTVPLMALGMMGGGVPPKTRKPKLKKGLDDTEKKKRKSVLGGKDKSGKRDCVADNIDGRVDDGAMKPPRQRFAGLIARAIGSGNGINSTNSASNPVSSGPSPTSANSTSSGSNSTPLPGITPGPEAPKTHHEPLSGSRSRSGSVNSHQDVPASSTVIPSVPTSESTPHLPATRMRSLSNANRVSPLRIEVLPYASRPSVAAITPTTVPTHISTSTSTSATATVASAVRGRSVSITGGPTIPLSPQNRTRSESQASEMSSISQSSVSSSVIAPSSASQSSISLSVMLDWFPSPGDSRDGSGFIKEDENKCGMVEEASDEETKSDASDIEDDGAYYVKSFERSFGDKNRLRSAKSREFKRRDDGDNTETEEMVRELPPHKLTKPSSRHLSRPSSGTLSAKPMIPTFLPISPPPSISPSPILSVQTMQLSNASAADLLDSDPFAATSLTILGGSGTNAQHHSVETRHDTTSSNHVYFSHSLHASKSATALHKIESSANTPASSPYKKTKSLMGSGDLPPSKARKVDTLSPELANSATHTISPTSPLTPLRGSGWSYIPPGSPGTRTPTTKSGLRMSVSGLVSRLTFGNRSREVETGIPLPPLYPGEEIPLEVPFGSFEPPLPTPAGSPTVPVGKLSLSLPLERMITPSSESEVGVRGDGQLDGDDSAYEPPSPVTPSSPYSDASSKRKSRLGNDGGSRLSLSYIRAKKYLLVVNGAGLNNERALEYVKEWCKGFGEVRRCTQKTNGDLHLEFKRGSVLDAMCRTQTINIEGAGSVTLNWYKGKDNPVKANDVGARV